VKRIHENTPLNAIEGRRRYREQIELLRSRVCLLAGKDKLLMTMYLENGNSFRQMARLAGVNEATIGRRIRKISRRLAEGEYIRCLRKREEFTDFELDVARDYFLSGVAIKWIAANRGSSYQLIRKIIKKIRRQLSKRTADPPSADLRFAPAGAKRAGR